MTRKPARHAGAATGFVDDAARFLGAGLVNTILTLGVYQLALFVVSASAAYALAWVVGLAFVTIVYPSQVFKGGDESARTRLAIIGVYVIGFVVGLVAIAMLSTTAASERLAIFAVVAATTAINFLSMRLVTRGARSSR